jgi:hypothetical protein
MIVNCGHAVRGRAASLWTVGVGVAAVVVVMLSGCTPHPDTDRNSSAAPPLIVCGTTLETTPAGAVLRDASMSAGTITIREQSANGIFLQTSKGCAAGASITVVPRTAAKQAKVAHTSDGRIAAVVLRPLQLQFQVIVSHPDGGHVTVNVNLPEFVPGESPTPTKT